MSIINRIIKLIKGNYKIALENGLNVGKGVSIVGAGRGISFGSEPYLITLGDYCRISNDVMFVTHDGGTWVFRDLTKYSNVIKYGRITVGEHTFVGARVIIMPGVNIGNRCVIGAGSVVTKDIPDGSIAVGIPATVVMKTEEYAEKCLISQQEYDIEAYMKDKKNYLLKWLK